MQLRLAILVAVVIAHGLQAEEPKSQTFDAKGVKIRYLTAGKGGPVVLIHGLLSSAEINWKINGVIAELAKDHQVIALDLPGHGQSDKPEKEEAYGLQLVEDIALLMDQLKIKKAHVVGYSLGGAITMKFMAKHPDRVLSGTVCGMGWLKDPSPILQRVWDDMKAPSGTRGSFGKLFLTEAELKKIDVPVKVIVGGKDDLVKGLYVDPLRRVRKDWPVVEIEKANHFDCILKPQFRDEIVAWVKKNSK
jgi:pimeloyl-ACP methyl ester carboxylesterase